MSFSEAEQAQEEGGREDMVVGGGRSGHARLLWHFALQHSYVGKDLQLNLSHDGGGDGGGGDAAHWWLDEAGMVIFGSNLIFVIIDVITVNACTWRKM